MGTDMNIIRAVVALLIIALATAHREADFSAPESEVVEIPSTGDDFEGLILTQKTTKKWNHRVVKNVRNLLAYAKVAKNLASDMYATDGTLAQSSILNLILQVNKSMKKKKSILLQYSRAMYVAKDLAGNTGGLGRYLLDNIHRSILYGKGVIRTRVIGDHIFAGLYHKRLGLREEPRYVGKLHVRLHKYVSAKHGIKTKGVCKATLKACVKTQTKKAMPVMVKKAKAKKAKRIRKALKKLTKGALKGIKKVKKTGKKVLKKKTNGGIKGAKAVLGKAVVVVPTYQQLKRQAAKAAARWAASRKKCTSIAALLK